MKNVKSVSITVIFFILNWNYSFYLYICTILLNLYKANKKIEQSKTNKYRKKITQKEYELITLIMEEIKKDLGNGYVSEACKAVGVTNTVFYTARQKLEKGDRLTKAEIKVLAKHKELIEEAGMMLKSLQN